MSYQVLARKWRPQLFREMVGQEHVLKALINALDSDRLHHAYLFTGTRGVGKTTIARILAKCLNCETGVSSEPCGQCSACTEITEGRFVDLIEVDAASRTKVEDTRELLDNVQYAPTRGRFKIYLIDEVHMLSNHSFNALLKTLEEPPAHVKFLLATTDPQKLPVTILSRCLQFNLKNMSPERIVNRLKFVLDKELVPFDDAGLWALARSADGSMRDAMSLTDQAISFGGGKLVEKDVAAMLGTIDRVLIQTIIEGLVASDGAQILKAVEQFAEHSPDFQAALADLLTMLHRIAIAQALPEALDNSYGDREQILNFATQLPSEDVQLFYQTALLGRRDLPLSPEPRSAFEMTMLRMLAFKPQGVADVPSRALPQSQVQPQSLPQSQVQPLVEESRSSHIQAEKPSAVSEVNQFTQETQDAPPSESRSAPTSSETAGYPSGVQGEHEPVKKPPSERAPLVEAVQVESSVPHKQMEEAVFTEPEVKASQVAVLHSSNADSSPSQAEQIKASLKEQVKAIVGSEGITKPPQRSAGTTAIEAESKRSTKKVSLEELSSEYWVQVYEHLEIKGILQSSISNCALVGIQENQLLFLLDEAKGSLFDDSHSQKLSGLLSDYFAHPVKVQIEFGQVPPGVETPAMHSERIKLEKHQHALNELKNDPVVQVLEKDFGAQLNEETIQY